MAHLEHIGIAVNEPAAVALLFEQLLGVAPYKQEHVEREGVRTHFIAAGTAKLELLEALGPDSPVARFLDKRGEGLHHLAFSVPDIDAQMDRVRALGFTPLSDAPRRGADAKRIFFLHPRETHGVLIEFCQDIPDAPLPSFRVPWKTGALTAYAAGRTPGTSVVVLHPLGGSTGRDTAGFIRLLEPRASVYALDFAGHGTSDDFPQSSFTVDAFADNVLALLDAQALDQVHLVGISTGTLVALRVALRAPARVDRLVLHSSPAALPPPLYEAFGTYLASVLPTLPVPSPRPETVQRVLDAWPHLAVEAPSALQLERITHPVLVSALDRDPVLPTARLLAWHESLPNARLAILPGEGHGLTGIHLPGLAALVLRHLLTDGASASV